MISFKMTTGSFAPGCEPFISFPFTTPHGWSITFPPVGNSALESMAIRPVAYLVSTRILAGMMAITPLYSIAVILSFVASQFTTTFLLGQSQGLYQHYFNTFLNPIDLLWSFLQAILMALTILLIHTYYGYFASGGPAGVGNATGNAVRTSLIVVVSVTLLVSLSIYGSNGNFNLSG